MVWWGTSWEDEIAALLEVPWEGGMIQQGAFHLADIEPLTREIREPEKAAEAGLYVHVAAVDTQQ